MNQHLPYSSVAKFFIPDSRYLNSPAGKKPARRWRIAMNFRIGSLCHVDRHCWFVRWNGLDADERGWTLFFYREAREGRKGFFIIPLWSLWLRGVIFFYAIESKRIHREGGMDWNLPLSAVVWDADERGWTLFFHREGAKGAKVFFIIPLWSLWLRGVIFFSP